MTQGGELTALTSPTQSFRQARAQQKQDHTTLTAPCGTARYNSWRTDMHAFFNGPLFVAWLSSAEHTFPFVKRHVITVPVVVTVCVRVVGVSCVGPAEQQHMFDQCSLLSNVGPKSVLSRSRAQPECLR